MSVKWKASVIGCGRMGSRHAKAYLDNEYCELIAIADLKREQYEKFNDETDCKCIYYDNYEDMIIKEKPDIVSICTYAYDHYPMIKRLIELGVKVIHCEKPLGPIWSEGQAIRNLMINNNDVQLTFNHQRRFLPAWCKAMELLSGGNYGKLEKMEAFIPANILDWGTHSFDFMNMFNKETPAKWVIGQIDSREHVSWFDIPFENMAIAKIRYENGVSGIIHCGDEKERDGGIVLYCNNGIIDIKGPDGRELVAVEFGGEALHFKYDTEMSLLEGTKSSINHAVSCALHGEEALNNWENAVRATEIIFAIYESSRSRKRIDLPLNTKDSAFLSMLKNGDIGDRTWFYMHETMKNLY